MGMGGAPSNNNYRYLPGSFRPGWGFTTHVNDHIDTADGKDSLLRSRSLGFYKYRDTSYIRIMWYDNFRCKSNAAKACRWDIKIDGEPCEDPGPIRMDYYNSPTMDNRWGMTVYGICK